METYLLIGCIGIFTGFISGLLGIGGGILMAPLLLYVPPLFGLEPYSMRTVAGLTIVMALVGCLSGGLTHRKFSFVSNQLAACMGSSIFIAALMGGAATRFVSNELLLFIFSCLAFVAAILMLVPTKDDVENPNAANFEFCKTRAVTAAAGVGLLGGLVGQGGSFILIPLTSVLTRTPPALLTKSPPPE